MLLKVIVWQGYERPESFASKVFLIIQWIIVIGFIVGINLLIRDEFNINQILKNFLRIYSSISIPFTFPALSISTKLNHSKSNWLLFRFHSVIGIIVAPFYVIFNVSKI